MAEISMEHMLVFLVQRVTSLKSSSGTTTIIG